MASKFAREEEYNYSCDSADESECSDVPDEDVEDHGASRRGGPCSDQGQGTCPGCGNQRTLYTCPSNTWNCGRSHSLCSPCSGERTCPVDSGQPRIERQHSSWCTIF